MLKLFTLITCVMLQTAPSPTTTPALRRDNVVDDYFGTRIPDPFRWLEQSDAPDTRAFIDQQNVVSRAWLDTPTRAKLRARLEALVNYPRQSTPARYGPILTYTRNTGLQAQSVIYGERVTDHKPFVVLDPNTLSKDGTVAVGDLTYTESGKLVAYAINEGGSDNATVKVREVATGTDRSDVLTNMRFSGIGWSGDSGFYYNKYPVPGTVPTDDERKNNKLYFHKLGTDSKEDELILARPDNPDLAIYPGVTRDQKWLFIYESLGTDPRNGLSVAPLGTKDFRRVIEPGVCDLRTIENDGSTLYALVDFETPRRKLVAIDLEHPEKEHWTTLIDQGDDTIESVSLVNEQFVVTYKHDAASLISIFDKSGKKLSDVTLPTVGTAWVSGRREDNMMFVGFTSYTYPTTIYTYDFGTGVLTPWFEPKVNFTPGDYVTREVFFASKDGTKVPMFITHKKDLKLDDANPTLLYGYGGFNNGESPWFSSINIAWLERGGVYADACIRGGDEYGSVWHEAGMLNRKQNVFDDFQAAGQWLIDNHYTTNKKLAIEGGSNGGLLAAACYLQRPGLYGAVVAQVGVLDMLRFQKFGTGRFWTVEYGSAEASEDQFKTLLAYSPLHNVKSGAEYPPILVTTGDGDDRVLPAHSLKFVATLLTVASPKNTVLLRYETRAGHGAGKPLAKVLDEEADVFAFLLKALGAE